MLHSLYIGSRPLDIVRNKDAKLTFRGVCVCARVCVRAENSDEFNSLRAGLYIRAECVRIGNKPKLFKCKNNS
jgi:hypothetical protein